MLKLGVVITTVRGYGSAVADWDTDGRAGPLIVVGDEQTPDEIWPSGVTYLSLEEQLSRWPELAAAVPIRHYARKMLGYVRARELGCTHVFETDDDNSPLRGWLTRVTSLQEPAATAHPDRRHGWLNSFSMLGAIELWPRGYPHGWEVPGAHVHAGACKLPIAVRQYACDGEPDVDAVQRMLGLGRDVAFLDREVALSPNAFTPINSQSTLWDLARAGDLMYLPVTSTQRASDVVRGYALLPRLWARGYTAAACGPLVRQVRNPHDLVEDLRQELPLYRGVEAFAQRASMSWTCDMWRVAEAVGLVSDAAREKEVERLFIREMTR